MRWLAVLLLWPCLVAAQDPGAQARSALQDLERASRALEQVSGSRDRVRALTQTISAFETGLAAIREGLRTANVQEDQLRLALEARRSEIADLLGVLLAIQPGENVAGFLHPQGIEGAVRAGLLLADVTPSLTAETQRLRQDLNDLAALRDLQSEAAAQLQSGLQDLQAARIALSTAIADRTDIPQRFVADPDRAERLRASADSLAAFAEGLDTLALDDAGWTSPEIEDQIGAFSLPVQGVVLRRAGEADAANVTRPGMVLATRPGALVTAPAAATIRYLGPFLDFGNVVILEPRADILFVFAGLETVFGEIGQIIPMGTPVGLMGGVRADLGTNSWSTGGEKGSNERSETLYIEVRQNNMPLDPDIWFRTDKDR